MMSSKDRIGQIIKAFITVVTLITLTSRFCIIKAAFDHMLRLTRGTPDAIGPAQLANGLITLHVIDEMLDVDLHGWTPVRDRGMGCRQYTPSSNVTTPESNMSDEQYGAHGVPAGALEGRDARLRCPPAPGVRCARVVGGRAGVGTRQALVAERVCGARARYCHIAGRCSGLVRSTWHSCPASTSIVGRVSSARPARCVTAWLPKLPIPAATRPTPPAWARLLCNACMPPRSAPPIKTAPNSLR